MPASGVRSRKSTRRSIDPSPTRISGLRTSRFLPAEDPIPLFTPLEYPMFSAFLISRTEGKRSAIMSGVPSTLALSTTMISNDPAGGCSAIESRHFSTGERLLCVTMTIERSIGRYPAGYFHLPGFMKRRRHTMNAASQMILFDIFEMPTRLSTNRMGISLIRNPFFQQMKFISIWNE